ncbi:PEP-utilizing enzyme [Conexibacter sp. SYSU D00693]|uniref:PEP-utilizing enzyme n=1 Tax=Conexibacter sp. SYSU D00693 TaxID=2812560 RepID=UPI00196A8CE3|nr:PEP-utilizing enzyme [Conexibacter sp. SYSU D00693]
MATSEHVRWTTVNFAEAIQGVQKPLSWGMWSLSMETSVRRTFGALGVLPAREVPVPASADERMSGMFFGRAAGNIEVFRRIGDGMPGSSGDVIEEKLFGKAPVGEPSRKPLSALRRYPVVAVKLPRAARRPPRELRPMRARFRTWWQDAVLDHPPRDLAEAQALLRASADRFIEVGVLHATTTLLASALLDQLGALAEKAVGDRALAMDLATGYGSMEETELIEDLWSASQGRLAIEALLHRHGYHGPDEGDLSSRTWREDRAPLDAILASYAKKDMANPREREVQQLARRQEAEARLLAGLAAARRPAARLTMRLAGRYIPLREIGKAAFLHALDGARCAARAGGRALADAGHLDDPDDAFFLTFDEFLGEPSGDLRERVAERRERHERYTQLVLPPSWTGPPVPIEVDPDEGAAADAPSALQGIGVVGRRVTGRARVVHDPMDADLDDGDILVCRTTDPSWTPLFMLADALVIDTGGQMSHGAIVARELGVTCVINTVTGTRDIPDGATITVDGSAGTVEIGTVPPVPA